MLACVTNTSGHPSTATLAQNRSPNLATGSNFLALGAAPDYPWAMARLILVLALFVSGCVGVLPDAGEAYCEDGAAALHCSGDDTARDFDWRPIAGCGDVALVKTYARHGDGARIVAGLPQDNIASACTEEGPICDDGTAPSCQWWAVPALDWQSVCKQLLLDSGLEEADCVVPLAPWPATTIDASEIFIR